MKKFLLISLILLSITGCESVQNFGDLKDVNVKNVPTKEINITEEEVKNDVNLDNGTINLENEVEIESKVKESKINSSDNKQPQDSSTSTKLEQKNNVSQQTENKDTNNQKQIVKESEKTIPTSGNDVEVNYTENSNDLMYSITHGIAEHSTESSCNSLGFKIKDKELDAIMDWNEAHPEQIKQPVIKSSMCLTVIKDGNEYWFLHFITEDGNNMDAELKELYK